MTKLAQYALCMAAYSLGVMQAQGTKTREDGAKYSAHAEMGSVEVGADFWGHFIPGDKSSIMTDGYLVVEVALFPPPKSKVAVGAGHFILTVNGQQLMPQSPGQVTLSMVLPDMREPAGPHLEADASVGPASVSVGRDPAQPRFPGDSIPGEPPRPPVSRPPEETPNRPIDIAKVVRDLALPEGSYGEPVSGYLFYAWSGKLKHIKHAEVEYTSAQGTAKLLIR